MGILLAIVVAASWPEPLVGHDDISGRVGTAGGKRSAGSAVLLVRRERPYGLFARELGSRRFTEVHPSGGNSMYVLRDGPLVVLDIDATEVYELELRTIRDGDVRISFSPVASRRDLLVCGWAPHGRALLVVSKWDIERELLIYDIDSNVVRRTGIRQAWFCAVPEYRGDGEAAIAVITEEQRLFILRPGDLGVKGPYATNACHACWQPGQARLAVIIRRTDDQEPRLTLLDAQTGKLGPRAALGAYTEAVFSSKGDVLLACEEGQEADVVYSFDPDTLEASPFLTLPGRRLSDFRFLAKDEVVMFLAWRIPKEGTITQSADLMAYNILEGKTRLIASRVYNYAVWEPQ